MATTEVMQMLAAAAAACEDKKAEDIRILALDPSESGLADYFLICNGTNDRQNVAITDEIEARLKRDFGSLPFSVEGRRQGEWVLMDYVDFIVHVFSPEKRAFYGLERLRKSATTLNVEELNDDIKAAISAARPKRNVPVKAPSKAARKTTAAMNQVAASHDVKEPASRASSTRKEPSSRKEVSKPAKAPAKATASKGKPTSAVAKTVAKKAAATRAVAKATARRKRSASKAEE